MNYSLAKQLKETGFIQRHGDDGKGEWIGIKEETTNPLKIRRGSSWSSDILKGHVEVLMVIDRDNLIYIPTLSELIEACGEGYFILEKQGDKWRAEYPHQTLRLLVGEYGSTPEEAVAKLWLEINKK